MVGQTSNEQAMLERVAYEHGVPAQVIKELLSLVTTKYPSMLKRGSKVGLRDDVMQVIERWVQQEGLKQKT